MHAFIRPDHLSSLFRDDVVVALDVAIDAEHDLVVTLDGVQQEPHFNRTIALWGIQADGVVGNQFALLLSSSVGVQVANAQLYGIAGALGLDAPGQQGLAGWHVDCEIFDFFLEVDCVDLAISDFVELHNIQATLLLRSLISWK
jgi:hypothetical protein